MEGIQLLEYIWIGGSGSDLRAKTKVSRGRIYETVSELPAWNYDGSSTGQATTEQSEMALKPVRICRDPFRGAPHLLVLCESVTNEGVPANTNFRMVASKVFEKCAKEDIWFGLEQEYILYRHPRPDSTQLVPLAWVSDKNNEEQGPYYCSVGTEKAIGRQVAEEHLQKCLQAGLNLSGINAEVFPGQWEYQLGICKGIDVGDQFWLARYVLERVCEAHGVVPNFHPKPITTGDWNGSGCHMNVSTASSRQNPAETIPKYMKALELKHNTDVKLYGAFNNLRMTGKHETSSFSKFTWSVGGRHTSVRIPFTTNSGETGYFEDRRTASNLDPYLACTKLTDTILLDSEFETEILQKAQASGIAGFETA